MFYTKYRPQKFSEISRPNEAADALSKEVMSGNTVHAYLFVGPRGTGKTSTARILSKALNCLDLDKNGDPCDKCSSCEAIKKGSYLDLIEIDAASNRGIDDIRELKNRVKLAPTAGKNKIYIIDEVHMLTTEAFNALLKTLEEPPKNTVFILCTTELHKMPDTIKSRCQVFKFKRATIRQLVTKLEKIVTEEALTVEKPDLEKIARASLGGFRDAETMLQQVSEGEVTVDSLLNVGSREKYLEFGEFLFKKDTAAAIKIANKIFDEGADLYVWSGEFIKHLRDMLMLKSGISFELLELPDELLSEIKEQAASVDLPWLLATLEVFVEAQAKIKTSFIPQLPVEIAIVKVCGNTSVAIQSDFSKAPQSPKSSNKNQKSMPSSEIKDGTAAQLEKEPSQMDSGNTLGESGEEVSDEASLSVIIEISLVAEKWGSVMSRIENINKSILGLLRAVKPVAVEGRFLVIEVSYAFHKERLEAPKNREVVERVLKDIFDADMRLRCVMSAEKPKPMNPREVGVLTDINVVAIDKNAVIDMLDGGLPL